MENKISTLEFRIRKQKMYFLIGIFIIFLGIVAVNAVPSGFWGHDASQVKINIPEDKIGGLTLDPGGEMTLQEAIDGPYLNPEKRSLPLIKYYAIQGTDDDGDLTRLNIGKVGACFLTSMTKTVEGVSLGGVDFGNVALDSLLPGLGGFNWFGSSGSIRGLCAAIPVFDPDPKESQTDPNSPSVPVGQQGWCHFRGGGAPIQCTSGDILLKAKRAACQFVCIKWDIDINGNQL